jgi:UDP-glucose 4-epimerase
MLAVVGGGGFIGTNIAKAFPARVIEKWEPLDFTGCTAVVHLAANADVRSGWDHPHVDVESGPVLTSRVLQAMREQGVRRLVFASSAAVYPPARHEHFEQERVQATSLYAASKLAGEALVHAYQAAGHVDPTILRFVSVLGPHYSHGLLCDFVKNATAERLPVLRPGTAQKSYVHVADVVQAFRCVLTSDRGVGTFNVATSETATPLQIAQWTLDQLGLFDAEPVLEGDTWVGDNPTIRLSNRKLRMLDWEPVWTIEAAVKDTVRWLTQ